MIIEYYLIIDMKIELKNVQLVEKLPSQKIFKSAKFMSEIMIIIHDYSVTIPLQ